jgi:hypothetical protein
VLGEEEPPPRGGGNGGGGGIICDILSPVFTLATR